MEAKDVALGLPVLVAELGREEWRGRIVQSAMVGKLVFLWHGEEAAYVLQDGTQETRTPTPLRVIRKD